MDFLFLQMSSLEFRFFFFFNDTATTEIYTLSLHDALPIFRHQRAREAAFHFLFRRVRAHLARLPRAVVRRRQDRKSTRLNSSHTVISYAVFCLKKKKSEEALGYTCIHRSDEFHMHYGQLLA